MGKKKHSPVPNEMKDNPFYDIENAASVTDMTGMIPVPPKNDAECESYEEMYAMHRQKPLK